MVVYLQPADKYLSGGSTRLAPLIIGVLWV
jgi:hypothetical protein